MRQEINFYRGGGRRPIPALGGRWILNAALGFVILLGAISAVQAVVNGRLNAELQMASRQAELMEKRIKDLQALYPEPKADERLLADADLLQRRVDDLERLLNVAADDGEIRRGGFSGYFEALARQAVPDVWLTGIRLTAGGREMELEGRSLDTAKIPLFVQALGRETVFAAKTFSNLAISRSEQRPGQVDFVLRTRTPGGDDDG